MEISFDSCRFSIVQYNIVKIPRLYITLHLAASVTDYITLQNLSVRRC